MGVFGLGRIITRFIIIIVSGWLSSLLSKALIKPEAFLSEKIEKYSRTNLKYSVRARRITKLIRVFIPFIIYSSVIAICIVGLVIVSDYSPEEWADSIFVSLVTIIIVLFINMISNTKEGNISTLVAEDVLSRKTPYTLYLRAFKSDLDSSNFSEKQFVSFLQTRGIPELYAVGDPKEKDAPIGAKRIYLDHSTWEEDVESLMHDASEIYLRVCDTEPCKWELGKSFLLMRKLTLIVDNISEYDKVRESYPNLPELHHIDGAFYFIRYEEPSNDWSIRKFKLSPKGYIDISQSEDEYEKIVHASALEQKRIDDQRINPTPIIIGLIVILFFLGGFELYRYKKTATDTGRYSLSLFYDRSSHLDFITHYQYPVTERFDANTDYDAYKYGEKRFIMIVDSLHSQYNGILEHDDSLDILTPLSFMVIGPNGRISDSKHDYIVEYSNLLKREEHYGAKWRMSIDSVQHLSHYSKWVTKEIHLPVGDTTEAVGLLRGCDTLASHSFDEYLFFMNSSSGYILGGYILLSQEHHNTKQVYSDVKYQLRKKYGTYDEYWDRKIKNITCDTVQCNGISSVVVKTELSYHPLKPRFDNLAQTIIEQCY